MWKWMKLCFGLCLVAALLLSQATWSSAQWSGGRSPFPDFPQPGPQPPQWSSGGCPSGGCPSSRGPSQKPSTGRKSENVSHDGYLGSVVRIVAGNPGSGQKQMGTGVLVGDSGRYRILTANHVVHGMQEITIVYMVGDALGKCQATVVATDEIYDVSVLKPERVPATVEDFVVETARGENGNNLVGKDLHVVGYGGLNDPFRAAYGQGLKYVQPSPGVGDGRSSHSYEYPPVEGKYPPDWIQVSVPGRMGDSGCPLFNDRNEVVGILWGSNGTNSVATSCGRLQIILQSEDQANQNALTPPVLPWRDGIEKDIDNLKKRPPKVEQPSKPGPSIVIDVPRKPEAAKPSEPQKQDQTKAVDLHTAITILCALALLSTLVGFVVQWKKTYSV